MDRGLKISESQKELVAFEESNLPNGTNAAAVAEADRPDEGKRIQWGGRFEFVLTLIGFAVGLGNVWRFPYLCYEHGGGAFLIPFFLMLFAIGIPIFMLELSVGQFASQGAIGVFNMFPVFKGVGICSVIISAGVGFYYNMIVAYALHFMVNSFTAQLPWAHCKPEWGEDCEEISPGARINCSAFADNVTNSSTAAQLYFNRDVLNRADDINTFGALSWELILSLLASWLIVFLVLVKGIESLGKIVYFTSIFPYVLLTVMLIWCATLPGADDGIKYYMTVDLNKLARIKPWKDAAVQVFYSLSVCSGGLIAMSSYNHFKNNILRDSLLVPIVNSLTSLYAGFVVFSVLGYVAKEKCTDVASVARQGPGLVFETYPEALALMKPAPLWSGLFFLTLAMLGFSSQFSTIECPLVAIIDALPYKFHKRFNSSATRNVFTLRLVYCAAMFVLGLIFCARNGIYFVTILDEMLAGIPLLVVGLCECAVFVWLYGVKRFCADVEMMIGKSSWSSFWLCCLRVCWIGLAPLCVVAILVLQFVDFEPLSYNNGQLVHDPWAQAMGWAACGMSIIFIPTWAVYYCVTKRVNSWSAFKALFRLDWHWGPADRTNWVERYNHLNAIDKQPSAAMERSNSYYLTPLPPPTASIPISNQSVSANVAFGL